MTWDSLSGLIVTKLQTLANVNDASIYDYEQAGFQSYPAITVTPSDNTSDFADTSRNYIRYTFNIRLYQERTEETAKSVELVLRQLTDAVVAAFNADPTLGGQLVNGYAKPIPSVWSYRQAPNVVERVSEIKYLTWFAQ